MTLVKICGIRTLAEARAATRSGADLLGFVFSPHSRRTVTAAAAARIIRQAREESAGWSAVGVFVDPTPDEVVEIARVCALDVVQLAGSESPACVRAMPLPVLKTIHVRAGDEPRAAETVETDAAGAHLYLLDTHVPGTHGGTGRQFDWQALRTIGPRCLVAGGLRPDNVGAALAALSPRGVDVSSGVEHAGGGKNPQLIRAFLERVKAYDRHIHP